jgi:hypothetical protein
MINTKNKYTTLFTYAIIIVFMDILSTYIVLNMNCTPFICYEGNPMARYIINSFGFMGLTLISGLIIYLVYLYKPVLVYSFVIVNTITTVGNILLISQYL